MRIFIDSVIQALQNGVNLSKLNKILEEIEDKSLESKFMAVIKSSVTNESRRRDTEKREQSHEEEVQFYI